MKNHQYILTILFINLIIFSGCINPENQNDNDILISEFIVQPNIIKLGENANLIWEVINAKSVNIDNGIGNVSLKGSRIISPVDSTIYTITAYDTNYKYKIATTEIIVINDNNQNETTYDNDSNNNSTSNGDITTDDSTNNNISTDKPIAIIDTSIGTIKVELFQDETPNTVEYFIKLTKEGFYENLVFDRVIENFIIQGGGYYSNGSLKRIKNDNIKLDKNNKIKHVDGSIGMSISLDPNIDTNQFYICDGDQPNLQGVYAPFGVVIEGINVVRIIASSETTIKFGTEYWPIEDIIIKNIDIIYE